MSGSHRGKRNAASRSRASRVATCCAAWSWLSNVCTRDWLEDSVRILTLTWHTQTMRDNSQHPKNNTPETTAVHATNEKRIWTVSSSTASGFMDTVSFFFGSVSFFFISILRTCNSYWNLDPCEKKALTKSIIDSFHGISFCKNNLLQHNEKTFSTHFTFNIEGQTMNSSL